MLMQRRDFDVDVKVSSMHCEGFMILPYTHISTGWQWLDALDDSSELER